MLSEKVYQTVCGLIIVFGLSIAAYYFYQPTVKALVVDVIMFLLLFEWVLRSWERLKA